eukprot:9018083-Heterocapsa_arctica.AAC.1
MLCITHEGFFPATELDDYSFYVIVFYAWFTVCASADSRLRAFWQWLWERDSSCACQDVIR